MKRSKLVGLAAAAVVVTLCILPAHGQENAENPGFLAAKGRVTFRRYCASCHGEKADGNGPVARMLKLQPADLRILTHSNDGEYPSDRVASHIDGREDVAAHGRRDMPIWGEVFQTPLVANPAAPDEDGETRANLKVRELVLFLETIQVEPAESAGEAEE